MINPGPARIPVAHSTAPMTAKRQPEGDGVGVANLGRALHALARLLLLMGLFRALAQHRDGIIRQLLAAVHRPQAARQFPGQFFNLPLIGVRFWRVVSQAR